MGENLTRLECKGWIIHHVSDHLAFAINDKQILLITNLCAYLVTNDRLNSRAGHERIRRGVLNNEYKSLDDVLTDMRLTPGIGVGYRMVSIKELA